MKTKRRKPTTADVQQSDYGSPLRVQKAPHAIVPRELSSGGIVLTHGIQILEPTALDAYLRRRFITQRQYDAGVMLAKVFNRAIHLPSVSASYGEVRGGGGGPDTGIDARKILWRILLNAGLALRLQTEQAFVIERRGSLERETMIGPVGLTQLGHITVSVCGYNDRAGGTRQIEKLRTGLDQLADAWSLPGAHAAPRKRKASAWRAQDARGADMPEARDFSWAKKQALIRSNGAETDQAEARKTAKD